MFDPEISLEKYRFKGFSKKGIRFEIEFLVKNNFIFSVIINSLYADLYITGKKIKIGSYNKIGESHLSDDIKDIKLKSKIANSLKMDLIIYYKGIILNVVPNIFFISSLNYESCVEISFKVLFKRFKKSITKNGNIFELLKRKNFTL